MQKYLNFHPRFKGHYVIINMEQNIYGMKI